MKRTNFRKISISLCLLAAFVLWTIAVNFIDVEPIGPNNSTVGFAALNGLVHSFTGVHMNLYAITDYLGLVPFGVVMGFAIIGLVQLIKRKSIVRVDHDIIALGIFYIIVMTVYVLFEFVVINCRPVLINGALEASYPSSTTTLVMCVMPTAIIQFNLRIVNSCVKKIVNIVTILFACFMVIGRFISGVHWVTDIIGGALFSAGIVLLYHAVISSKTE